MGTKTADLMSYHLLSYQVRGVPRAGILVDDMVFDAVAITSDKAHVSILGVLEDWDRARRIFERAARLIATGKNRAKGTSFKRVRLLAPVLYPGAVYCAGPNYSDHMQEIERVYSLPPEDPRALGLKPWHFMKVSRAAVVGPTATVALPAYSQKVDWEIELVAVIGRRAKNVPVQKALSYVAGYTIANDLSARDAFRREQLPEGSPTKLDWVSQKCFDGACPVGPWIVPARMIAEPQRLAMKLWVNDTLMQDSSTEKMIFSVAEQVAHLSTRATLHPGDLVLTGTPAGVGMARGMFLKSGDSLRLWIERIGELRHRVV